MIHCSVALKSNSATVCTRWSTTVPFQHNASNIGPSVMAKQCKPKTGPYSANRLIGRLRAEIRVNWNHSRMGVRSKEFPLPFLRVGLVAIVVDIDRRTIFVDYSKYADAFFYGVCRDLWRSRKVDHIMFQHDRDLSTTIKITMKSPTSDLADSLKLAWI